jgi:acyl carrier protein
MQSPEIYARLTPLFHDLFDDPELILSPTLTAKDVDGWDSLNHVRLVLSVQKAFGVKFSASEISKLGNVGELVELIEVKSRPSAPGDGAPHPSVLHGTRRENQSGSNASDE